MRLLVTGGAGFIGSNFIRHVLIERPEWEIVNLDKLTYAGQRENLADFEGDRRYLFVQDDIADPDLVASLLTSDGTRPDAIVNFAAETHVDRSIQDSTAFVETNVKGVQVLLDTARRLWVSSGGSPPSGVGREDSWPPGGAGGSGLRFLHVSTDEVYGSLAPGWRPFSEESPLRPNNPYAASKAAADLLCRAYNLTYGFPVTVTRSCNNYGPYQHPEKLVPVVITRALLGQPVPLYGDGTHLREWLHVSDHCRALLSVLERGQLGRIYNIGSGQVEANRSLVLRILRCLGRPADLVRFVADRPGHDRCYRMDSRRLRRELAWRPALDLEIGLEATVRWYAANREWWSAAIRAKTATW